MSGIAHLFSPDTDTFTTPPTTPGFNAEQIRPSLSRRSSRPSSIQISRGDWTPGIVLDDFSPEITKKQSATSPVVNLSRDPSTTPRSSVVPFTPPSLPEPTRLQHHTRPMDSPCFVHSHLDKGASLTEWLRNHQRSTDKSEHLREPADEILPKTPSFTDTIRSESDGHEEYGESLTKQLAETAVGVREMSKQLGRARVHSDIQTILIVTKARDNRLIKLTRELALYLMLQPRNGQARGLVVYVDHQLRHSRRFDAEGIRRDYPELFLPFPSRRTSSSTSLSSLALMSAARDNFSGQEEGQLRYWTSRMCSSSPHLFDFVVTLGGDGTILFTSWLFQRIVPPVLPFALGSLGFLTNFDFADHRAVMDSALDSGIRVNLRMRFTCTVYRAVSNEDGKGRKAMKKGDTGEILMKNIEKGGWEALEGGWSGSSTVGDGKLNAKDREIMCFTTRPVETFEVLNDLVVDRGPSPYVSLLELFGDEHHMTTVQADGLTVSTPTGSTAYSLSAGGSLVHPEIPAILITPICPHTLSFRPMLLPDSMELRICVPYNSRSTAWASFDGRGRIELRQGDHIKVSASKYPFPTVCADKQSTDWFHSISRTLKWNERERQKSFVVVEEEGLARPKKTGNSSRLSSEQKEIAQHELVEELTEESDEDGEDDSYDIDHQPPETINSPHTTEASGRLYKEDTVHKTVAAATADDSYWKRSNSRSRSHSGCSSGVVSPGRFAVAEPHLRSLSPRRVNFDLDSPSDASEETRPDQQKQWTRDSIPSRISSAKTRVHNGKDPADNDSVTTPTAMVLPPRRLRGRHHTTRSRSVDYHGRRAFAVWGHDESDSNASDSSAGE